MTDFNHYARIANYPDSLDRPVRRQGRESKQDIVPYLGRAQTERWCAMFMWFFEFMSVIARLVIWGAEG